MRLILVRHGETELNRDGRIQGVNDRPLTSAGRRQAGAAGEALARDLPFAMYASPIARAVETARIIGERLGTRFTTVSGLAEADVGELDGLTGEEMRRRYPEFAERWEADPCNTPMPGGESLVQLQERAWKAVEGLRADHAGDSVVAVTHNFTIQAVIASALSLPLEKCRSFRIGVGSITRMDLAEYGNSLVSLGESWHLESAGSSETACPGG